MCGLTGASLLTAQNRKKAPPVKIPDPPIKIAADLYNKKDYPKAIEILEKIIAEFPDSADALYYLGDSYLKIGEYETGVEKLKKVSWLSEKYKNSYFQINYSDIPIKMMRLNYDGDDLISKLANGLRISGGAYQENASEKILNKIAYPVWVEAGLVTGYGGELGGFYSPVSFSVGFYMGEINLRTVKKKFALPPGIPSSGSSGFDNTIKVNSVDVAACYTPAVFLWGYLYPSVGACYVYGSYKRGSQSTTAGGFGLCAEVMAKFKNIFIKGGYKKGIDDKSFDNKLSVQLGFKINMFK